MAPLFGKQGLIGAITVDNRRGGRRFVADDITLIEGLSNQASIAVENARLVDDLRRSREQVRRADRLGSLGMLAAGLAHEINNPLVAINTFLAMAPAQARRERRRVLGRVSRAHAARGGSHPRAACARCGGSGRAAPASMPCETFAPGEVASEVVTLLHREAELGRVTLALERRSGDAEGRGRARSDPPGDAQPGAERAGRDAARRRGVRAHGARARAATAWRSRCATRARASRPSTSSRSSTRSSPRRAPTPGRGLGLMVCHRIATDHGGTIEVTSREGRGAAFLVRLPLDAREAPAPDRALAELTCGHARSRR